MFLVVLSSIVFAAFQEFCRWLYFLISHPIPGSHCDNRFSTPQTLLPCQFFITSSKLRTADFNTTFYKPFSNYKNNDTRSFSLTGECKVCILYIWHANVKLFCKPCLNTSTNVPVQTAFTLNLRIFKQIFPESSLRNFRQKFGDWSWRRGWVETWLVDRRNDSVRENLSLLFKFFHGQYAN